MVSPFSRASALLRYARPATWTARLAGAATAVLYTILVLVLGLFVDLLVTRGRVPTFAQLTVRDQEAFVHDWATLSEDDRAAAIRHTGFANADALPASTNSLVGREGFPAAPLPSTTTGDALRTWAATRGIAGDPYLAASAEHEWRWRAFVWHTLNRRVNSSAADRYQPAFDATQAYDPGDDGRRSMGVLGLVVRHRNNPVGYVTGTFASIAGWTWNGKDANRAYLTGLLIVGLSIVFLRGAFLVLMNEAGSRAALEAVTRVRRSLYHHTARQGAMTISSGAVDEAGLLFTRQAQAVHDSLEYDLTHTWRSGTLFVLLFAVALLTHFWLALAFVLLALVVWSVAGQMSGAFKRQGRLASRVAANRLELLLESLRHMRLVKSYLMELFNQTRVERQLADYGTAHLRRSRGDAFARPLLLAFSGMAALALLFLAGMVVLHEGLSVAGLAVLMVAFLSMYFPVRGRLAGRRVMRHGRDGAAEIYDFLDRRGDVAQFPDADFLPGVTRGIEFADVTVREPGTGRLLLNRASFKVKAGQRVGVVGADSDETLALVSLVPRFLDPTEGEIKIDGRNVKWVTQDSLRAQVGMVLQNSLVFNDTVSNNIGCGDPSFTLPQIIEAAKLAHAHQFIQRLPYGYETPIGDLGHSLTAGQQFRIALARAILRDPSVYVIEEPADSLDEDTKDLVDDTLDRVLPGKTVIYLPHRVSTLRECDKIVLLHEGKVAAAGEHRDLISDNELYRHLYYLEYNPFAAEAAG